ALGEVRVPAVTDVVRRRGGESNRALLQRGAGKGWSALDRDRDTLLHGLIARGAHERIGVTALRRQRRGKEVLPGDAVARPAVIRRTSGGRAGVGVAQPRQHERLTEPPVCAVGLQDEAWCHVLDQCVYLSTVLRVRTAGEVVGDLTRARLRRGGRAG